MDVKQGPRPGLIGGNLPAFNKNPLDFLMRCTREYGDFVRLNFAGFPIYLLNDPDLIEEVLVTKNRQFIKGRGLARTRELLGNGLLTSEGDFWRRQRRLAQPAFHTQRIARYGEIMERQTVHMLDRWQSGQEMDAHVAMMDLTMEIVALALFNTDVTGEANVVQTSMEVMLKGFSDRNRQFLIPEWLPTPARRRLERATHQLDQVVYGIIQERRSTPPDSHPQDLLEMLLNAQDENGEKMTDRQLRDEVMTLFLAGHETTANALSWTWMLLSQNPRVEDCLHEELDVVLQGRTPSTADLPNLPYTNKVVKESMRLYPPAWVIGRQAVEAVEIGGHMLEKDAGVLMSQYAMHRNPRYFPDPEAFLPERWDEAFSRQLPDYAYFPFGGGPRLCIGKPFAMQEAALVLAMVAQKFHLRLLPGKKITPRPSITLRPWGGVWVKVTKR